MATDKDFAGGADMEWSKWANGETAKRKQVAYNPDAAHRANYSDEWALATFGADPYNGPVGTQDARHRMGSLPPEIYAKHK